jgi:ectoine hydroxylase-related dioxygenase (phytanoyl-CoA dioxygenase family)
MRLIPGSHLGPTLPHVDTFHADNMLTRGQEIAVAVDEAKALDITLETGEAAVFAYGIAHCSPPNQSDDRRIAVVLRYIPPETRQTLAEWDSAALVRGADRYRHFTHEPVPARDFDPAAVAFHRQAEEQQRQIYYQGTGWQQHRT